MNSASNGMLTVTFNIFRTLNLLMLLRVNRLMNDGYGECIVHGLLKKRYYLRFN